MKLFDIPQVDKGAIKFVLSGANIMCPGLTSPGAKMTPDLEKDTVVAIMAEGEELISSYTTFHEFAECSKNNWNRFPNKNNPCNSGKEHALAVGLTSLSVADIAAKNKGIGVENIHYLNDGLWQMKPVK